MTENTENMQTPEQEAKDISKALLAYSQEIAPLVRLVAKKKDLLKDFKESDQGAIDLAEIVTAAQEALKAYIESTDDGKEIMQDIKDAENELKQAIKGAAKATEQKPADLKAFFVARSKDQAVKKVIDKGDKFETLNKALGA